MKVGFTTDATFNGKETSADKDETLNFQVVEGGYIYFALGGKVHRAHASWSSKIAQSSLPQCELVDLNPEEPSDDPEAHRENVLAHKISLDRAMRVVDDDGTAAGGPRRKTIQSSQSITKIKENRMVGKSSSSTVGAGQKSMREVKGKDYYWIVLRTKIKFAAREYALGHLREIPDDTEYLAHVGHLFVDSGPTATHTTHKHAALLLQKARDQGFEGGGKFFRELATSHMRTYLSGGLKSEREHLVYASKAWKVALTYLENATSSSCWTSCAMAYSYLGEVRTRKAPERGNSVTGPSNGAAADSATIYF